MDENKKKKGHRAYLNDFTKTAGGEYAYTGTLYEYDESELPLKTALIRLWIGAILAIVSSVISGCIDVPFMKNTWYVIAPFAAELVASVTLLWAVSRLSLNIEELREYVHKQTFSQIKPRAWLTLVFAALGIVSSLIFIIIQGVGEQWLMTSVYLLLKALSLLGCVLAIMTHSKMNWKKHAQQRSDLAD